MTDIYIVTEYYGDQKTKTEFFPSFIREETKGEINNQNWSLIKIYAFKDKDSAKVLASRINENNDSDYCCVKIDKKQMSPTEDSLIDNENIYAVMVYNEYIFTGEIDIFQDEINAQIHKDAMVKVKHEFFKVIQIPISPELRLKPNGNFTSNPEYLDFINQDKKKFKIN